MQQRRLGLRIPAKVHDRLRWKSFRTRRSINSIVLEAIERELGGDTVLRQIWRHMPTENRYAIQLEGDEITGAMGPLFASGAQVDPVDLETLDYDENPELVAWIKAHELDFERLEEYDQPEAEDEE